MSLERVTSVPELPRRRADSNKGDYGRILVVAGSRGMSGAAVLCGSAALRGGGGLVTVATPREVWPLVAGANPCYMTLPLDTDVAGAYGPEALAEVLAAAEKSDVVALGPGLGRAPHTVQLVSEIVKRVAAPLVLDADGLNACAAAPELLDKRAGATIVTPHPGEFARLLGKITAEVQGSREELAVGFARQKNLTVLLKGHRTIVTDGKRLYVNSTGNPGMATAGSGDVLTGLIAALVGQGQAPFEAAQLGAHIHGTAGDLASTDLAESGLIASDLIAYLPKALRTQHRRRT